MRVWIVTGLAGVALAAAAGAQQASDPASVDDTRPIIASTADGALPPPDAWRCDRIVPAWREWQERGQPADQWRYAGQRYRDGRNGQVYDWQDWLDWYDDRCVRPAAGTGMAGTVATPAFGRSGLPAEVAYVGGVFAIGAAIVLIGGNGEQNDSPG